MRDNFRYQTEFGSITEFKYFPSIQFLTSPWQPLPSALARAESANVASTEGAEPELVGQQPLPELRLTHQEIAALPGYQQFWDSLQDLLHAKLLEGEQPAPSPE